MQSNDKKYLFIIEDSEDLSSLMCLCLEKSGYAVEFACNGKDALEKLAKAKELPAVILLDLKMPLMNGAQFRAVQEKDPRLSAIPVIVVTADPNAEAKAEQIGAHGFIQKPMDLASLLEVAAQYCDDSFIV